MVCHTFYGKGVISRTDIDLKSNYSKRMFEVIFVESRLDSSDFNNKWFSESSIRWLAKLT